MKINDLGQDEKTEIIVNLISSGAMCGCLEHYEVVLNAMFTSAVSDSIDLESDGIIEGAAILKKLANAIGKAQNIIK